MCGFEPGMKLEVPNKDYKSTYWLATIIAKATPLILVRYEGFKENNNADFWCNTLTDDIHPVGWCARSKHALKPPKGIHINFIIVMSKTFSESDQFFLSFT